MKKYNKLELKERVLRRVALVLYEQWEESGGGDTRVLDYWMVPDEYVVIGMSREGIGRREHVVPRKVIRDECLNIFENNNKRPKEEVISIVAKLIEKLLLIVYITKKEAHNIDINLSLRASMPEGWIIEGGNVFARLKAASVKFRLEKNEYFDDKSWSRIEAML